MTVVGAARGGERLSALASELGPAFRPVICDVACPEQVGALFAFQAPSDQDFSVTHAPTAVSLAPPTQPVHEEKARGKAQLLVVVNCAGASDRRATVRDGNMAAWRELLDVNVLGLAACMREAFSRFEAELPGRAQQEARPACPTVINVGSLSGHRVPSGAIAAYAASKHAVTIKPKTVAFKSLVPTHH